jgi:methionyl-tRNA formyltransferase
VPDEHFLAADLVVSYNYSHIISQRQITLCNGHIINLHISYLPWNRGASPNFWSFHDDTPKGVTIHFIDSGIDTGDILCQEECVFDEDCESFASAYSKLHEEIQKLFRENWDAIKNGSICPVPQIGKGTYHNVRETKEIVERFSIDWNENIGDCKKRIFCNSG